MTKFETAKADTIERWEQILLWEIGEAFEWVACGFCIEYKKCVGCPIARIEGEQCTECSWYDDWDRATTGTDKRISLTLAILGWVYELKEP